MPPSISDYCRRLANTSIGPSTLRNQGASGIVEVARNFVKQLDLAQFATSDRGVFSHVLNIETKNLQQSFPIGARKNWGAARKSINLYLAEAYYHQFVCKAYGLDRIVDFLEVPLDGQVAAFLQSAAQKHDLPDLPRWLGIKYVTSYLNEKYQDFALTVAHSYGSDWARIHLDLVAWGR